MTTPEADAFAPSNFPTFSPSYLAAFPPQTTAAPKLPSANATRDPLRQSSDTLI